MDFTWEVATARRCARARRQGLRDRSSGYWKPQDGRMPASTVPKAAAGCHINVPCSIRRCSGHRAPVNNSSPPETSPTRAPHRSIPHPQSQGFRTWIVTVQLSTCLPRPTPHNRRRTPASPNPASTSNRCIPSPHTVPHAGAGPASTGSGQWMQRTTLRLLRPGFTVSCTWA